MKQLILCYVLIMLFPLSAFARQFGNDTIPCNRITMEGASSIDISTWRFEMSYHYMMHKYCGLGISFGFLEEYTGENMPSGEDWRMVDDFKKVSHIYFCPSIHLTVQDIVKISNTKLGLFVEPGMRMFIPYARVLIERFDSKGEKIPNYISVNSHKGEWAYVNIKLGLCIHTVRNLGFSFGYSYSPMDMYYLRRIMHYKNESFNDFYPPKKSIKELTFTMSYTF